MIFRPHTEEVYPRETLYIKDTIENRTLLSLRYGNQPCPDIFLHQYSYIKFNIIEGTWTSSFDFEWLYRNTPPLTPIEEIIKEYETN